MGEHVVQRVDSSGDATADREQIASDSESTERLATGTSSIERLTRPTIKGMPPLERPPATSDEK
jgi:hypothetical protein